MADNITMFLTESRIAMLMMRKKTNYQLYDYAAE
jgi:hypothetical protein